MFRLRKICWKEALQVYMSGGSNAASFAEMAVNTACVRPCTYIVCYVLHIVVFYPAFLPLMIQ